MDLGVRALGAEDLPFVYATWLKQVVKNCVGFEHLSDARLYHKQMQVVKSILSRAATLVAHLPDDPHVILGYLVLEKSRRVARPIIHWIYVKSPWRENGIAAQLLGELSPNDCVASYMSRVTQGKIISKYPGLQFDPGLAR